MPRPFLPLLVSALAPAAVAQQFDYTPGLIPGPARWTEGVECADVDNDGDLDIFFADGDGFASAGTQRQNVLIVNKLVEIGPDSFADESVARLGVNLSNAKGVTTGDVDSDGWVDALFANAFNTDTPFLYHNRGAAQPGFFDMESAARGFTENLSSAGAQFGDLDCDGDLDVIICDSGSSFFSGTGGMPRLFFNDGAGNFTENAAAMNAVNKRAHMDVQLIDIDNDWDLDFFGSNRASNSGGNHYLMLNDGDGNFTDVSNLLPGTSSNVYEAEVGDLDGDDDLDLFFVSFSGFQEGSVRNQLVETNNLAFTASGTLPGFTDDNEIVLIDYDVDGDLDPMVGSLGNREALYRNDGSFSFVNSSTTIEAVNDSTLDATAADLDNDGDYDLITAQGESNSSQWVNKIYKNSGPVDDRAPEVLEVLAPGVFPSFPAIVKAKVRDQVIDDGVNYVTARANVAVKPDFIHGISITPGGFNPPVLNLGTGEPVVFDNSSGQAQTVTSQTAPYSFDYALAPQQFVEIVFVTPGTYDIVSTTTGQTCQVVCNGPVTEIEGTSMGGGMFRFAVPSMTGAAFAMDMFFEDWPGNVSHSGNVCFFIASPGGVNYCGPAVTNSSGSPATMFAFGSPLVADNNFSLSAVDLPTNQFGYFLGSETQAFIPMVPGSQGNLCVGGLIGRFITQVQSSGATGTIGIQVDLANLPAPLQQAVVPGETWNFTAWFRDMNPNATSNFSDGYSVVFQ